RRWGIRRHDLHHVAKGFGTDLLGEWEISAWELRRGVRHLGPYVAGIVCSGALFGFLLSPQRCLRAFQRSGRGRASLFSAAFESDASYQELLAMSVGE